MNLISPVKNIQQTAISCPHRGLCHGIGTGFLDRRFLCEKQRYNFSRTHKPFLYVYQIQYLVYRKQFIQSFSRSTRFCFFTGVTKTSMDRMLIYTPTHKHTHTHTHRERGRFLNSKGIAKTYLCLYVSIFLRNVHNYVEKKAHINNTTLFPIIFFVVVFLMHSSSSFILPAHLPQEGNWIVSRLLCGVEQRKKETYRPRKLGDSVVGVEYLPLREKDSRSFSNSYKRL